VRHTPYATGEENRDNEHKGDPDQVAVFYHCRPLDLARGAIMAQNALPGGLEIQRAKFSLI
jgi:hypothetical protein